MTHNIFKLAIDIVYKSYGQILGNLMVLGINSDSQLLDSIIKKCSATGNRTPVSRVTGGDTHHYTIVESRYCAHASLCIPNDQSKILHCTNRTILYNRTVLYHIDSF